MDVIGCSQFDHHTGNDIGEEDGAFGDVGTDQVESGCQKNHVEDVIDEACGQSVIGHDGCLETG